MEPITAGILLFVLMFVLIFLGVHVAIALGISAAAFLYFFHGGLNALTALATKTYATLDSFTLMAVPCFLLMAEGLVQAKLAKDLFDAASNWLGFLKGGIAQATIVACAVFAAICGSSTAGVAAFGVSATPEMERLKYPRQIAYGTVAAGATLGILIPPSIPFIVYGSITEQSVGQLFMAGVIPGIIITVLLMIYIGLVAVRRPDMPKGVSVSWRQRIKSLKTIWVPIILIVVVLGGIYTGICTPTEAAGVGATTTLLIAAIMRRLDWKRFTGILMKTAQNTAMILMLVVCAMVFGYILTLLQAPQKLTQWVLSIGLSPWGVIVAVNLLLLFLGCLMDALSMMVIMCPILYPVVVGLGFDPIWFGVVFVINMEIGLITPPFGLNVFVLKGIRPEVSIGEIFRGVIPFCVVLLIGLAIMIAFPPLSTWLPGKMFKLS